MSGVSAVPKLERTKTIRHDWRETDRCVGDIARMLWPHKTASHIAVVSACSVRQAERFLEGRCEWSGDAIAAIVSEILKRHQMRNVKVRAK